MCRIFLFAAAFCCFHITFARDMSALYTDDELKQWKPALEKEAREILKYVIEPQLKAPSRELLQGSNLEFPLRGPEYGDPFEYSANFSVRRMTIPILSMKFLRDLIYADLWLQYNDYSTVTTGLYLTMLKYREAAEFPGGRYPPPLSSLRIPESAPGVPKEESAFVLARARDVYRNALIFLLAHETGHLVFKHEGSSVENEKEADVFAIQIMGNAEAIPSGLIKFFTFANYWVENRADSDTELGYQAKLFRSPHPLTGERVLLVGVMLSTRHEVFFPGLPDTDERVQLTKQVGSRLIDLAKSMDNLSRQVGFREVGRNMNLSGLAPRR